MKRTIFIALLLSTLNLSARQITGLVQDPTGQPIPYATISLLQSDSTLITGAISDDQGNYNLTTQAAEAIIQASYIGYTTQSRLLTSQETTVNFTLQEETEVLSEVEVKADRPLIERQMDKIVMNVSQSAFAIGSSGDNLLKKAPGVVIDKDGNITVNGKSVEVYIDGRPSYLSGEQLQGMLRGTDGATIDKIEIITNPSSKYDAAGQGGIINIKLKKNKSKGLNGMLNASYGGMYFAKPQRYYQNDFVSLNLNYRGEKTYTALSLTQVYNSMGCDFRSNTNSTVPSDTTTMFSRSMYDLKFKYYMAKLSNDWYIDSTNTLGFIVQVPILKMNYSTEDISQNYAFVMHNSDTVQHSRTTSSDNDYMPQHTANINFTHTFSEALSRELTINLDYNRNANRGTKPQKNMILKDLSHSLPQELNIYTQQDINIYSAKLDFQTGFWKTGMLEFGAKYALSNTLNSMQTDSILNKDTLTSRKDFDYYEHVAAIYISAAKQFGEHWNVKLGLRGELTSSRGIFRQGNEEKEVKQKPYFNLFPTVFVGYNPTQDWSMNISYTRRIKRPDYNQFNPFLTYLDAHTYSEGNPDLKPEFNNQVDVNFAWSRYVSLGFNFAHTQNMLNQQTTVRENGDVHHQWVNFGTCTTHGGCLSLTEIPLVPKFQTADDGSRKLTGAWLALTTNVNCYYFINRSQLGDNYLNKNVWTMVYGCLTSYLPYDIQISLDGYWDSPIVNGYMSNSGGYGMNFAFKKQFLQKTLTLNLNVQDLLRSTYYNMAATGLSDGYSNLIHQDIYCQSISVGISWLFGQQQSFRYRSKVGQLDESSRLGSSGGVGKGK